MAEIEFKREAALQALQVNDRVTVPDWSNGRRVGYSEGTIIDVMGDDADPTGGFIVRVDSTGTDRHYFGYSLILD